MALATTKTTVTLRLMDSADGPSNPYKLPRAFTGTYAAANRYAAKLGYQWRQDATVFRGYFAHPETGACLIPTVY